MTLICGIDEAGRGPVIGPLVLAGVVVDELDENLLTGIGVKDSKLLTPKQREDLFDKIVKIVKEHKIIIVPPREIDDALNHPTLNLNWLEALKTADIINSVKCDKVIDDCPSSNPKAYKTYLKNKLVDNPELIVEYKADVNYPVVGAASILAKVTRDSEVKKIQEKIGEPIGSGYPADPITSEFLKNNWSKYPEIFRQTWASYKRLATQPAQMKLGEF